MDKQKSRPIVSATASKTPLRITAFCASAMLLARAGATPLVSGAGTDGSFETPAEGTSGYYYNPTAAFISTAGIIRPPSDFNGPTSVPEGLQYAFLQSNTNDSHDTGQRGEIDLTITGLTVGDSYTLHYEQASRGPRPPYSAYTVTIGGTATPEVPSSLSFVPVSIPFTASATQESLTFLSTGPTDSTTFLDAITVPEPAALSLLGLGAVNLLARQRRD